MSILVLSDDDVALLRFTCDLFFVEESPLYAFEQEQREPRDYEGAYHALVEKGVIDPHGFRITDDVLNRIAPVTECDARVVHLVHDETGAIDQTDYYLLDEIAVRFQQRVDDGSTRHVVGVDMDLDELVEHLARFFVPRRAGGDRVDVALSPLEFLALTLLLGPVRLEKRRGGREDPTRRVALDDARKLLGKPPTEEQLIPGAAGLVHVQKRGGQKPVRTDGLVGDPTWDAAVQGLVDKGVYRHDAKGHALVLRPGLYDFVHGLQANRRHTFVRYDFGDDEWFMRETSFVPVDGGLFYVGPRREGGLRILELDGEGLRTSLYNAVGPLGGEKTSDEHKKLAGFLKRQDAKA